MGSTAATVAARRHRASAPTLLPSGHAEGQEATTDVDGFITANRATWDRLDQLSRTAARRPDRLTGPDVHELVGLHLRASSHLSQARTVHADPELVAHLSRLVARSSAIVHGTRPRTWSRVLEGVTRTFPAAVWHARLPILVSTIVFASAMAAMAVWLATTPAAYEAAMPADVREAYLERDFEAYYSSEPGTAFAARIFTNNAGVAALAFGTGVAFGVPTLLVLVLNAVNVGLAAGMFHAAGDAARFWALILPHGLLELTAIFVAAGAGLRLGWAATAPGDRTRAEALAEEGRRAVVIVIGLVVVFLVAAVVEAFVTPAPWPDWARVGTGMLVWAAFCLYVVVFGRRAAALGLTGAPDEVVPDHNVPVDFTSR